MRKQHALAQAPSSASLHPTTADRFITGATADGWVRIYDYETGAERETHKGHHGPAHAVSYSPDGELAASGSEDGECARLASAREESGKADARLAFAGTIRLWQTYPGRKYGLWA